MDQEPIHDSNVLNESQVLLEVAKNEETQAQSIMVKYCDTYHPVTRTCTHTHPLDDMDDLVQQAELDLL